MVSEACSPMSVAPRIRWVRASTTALRNPAGERSVFALGTAAVGIFATRTSRPWAAASASLRPMRASSGVENTA